MSCIGSKVITLRIVWNYPLPVCRVDYIPLVQTLEATCLAVYTVRIGS